MLAPLSANVRNVRIYLMTAQFLLIRTVIPRFVDIFDHQQLVGRSQAPTNQLATAVQQGSAHTDTQAAHTAHTLQRLRS